MTADQIIVAGLLACAFVWAINRLPGHTVRLVLVLTFWLIMALTIKRCLGG